MVRGMSRTRSLTELFNDLSGLVTLYSMFSFAAMIVFGSPLLYLYRLLDWTSLWSFAAGGAVCAAITYTIMDASNWQSLVMFSVLGTIEGVILRLVLFGVASRPSACA
jgi:hypothetical protein